MAQQELAAIVQLWSSAWLQGTGLQLAGPLRPWNGDGRDWKIAPAGVAISIPAEAQLVIAGLMLGEQLPAAKVTGADRRLIDEMARRCTDALADALVGALDLPARQAWQRGSPNELGEAWCGSIGVVGGGGGDGRAIIHFAIASDLLVRLVRRAAPPQPTQEPLSSLERGLEGQLVGISAFVGRCQVSIADLATLEPGDVLCLDTPAGAPVKIAFDNMLSPAACIIEQDAEGLRLRLVE
jgi:hypothetical protein